MKRHIHEAAWSAASRLVGIVAPCLREEERLDCYAEFYKALMEEIQEYEKRKRREARRLDPEGKARDGT